MRGRPVQTKQGNARDPEPGRFLGRPCESPEETCTRGVGRIENIYLMRVALTQTS